MPLVLAVVVVAVAVGYALRGRLRGLAELDLRHLWLLGVGVVAQLGVFALPVDGPGAAVSPPLLVASFVAVIGFLLANRHLPGMWLAAAGVALNAVVIAANGAMPVSPSAVAVVSDSPASFPVGKHAPLDADTRLPWLADVIPVPPLRSIVSVGDVVLAAGVARLVVTQMVRARTRRTPV